MTLGELHPVLKALILMLPPVGSPWPTEARLRWLAVFKAALDLIYP